MALLDTLVVFLVSLLIGALGIYVGARVASLVVLYALALLDVAAFEAVGVPGV